MITGKKAKKRAERLAAALARERVRRTPPSGVRLLDPVRLDPVLGRPVEDRHLPAPQVVEVLPAPEVVDAPAFARRDIERSSRRRVLATRLLLMGLALGGCAPSPLVLRQNIGQLRALAEHADRIHAASCGPRPAPFPPSTTGGEPGPVDTLPASCGPLELCAHQAQDAARICQDGIGIAAGTGDEATYAARAALCQVSTRQAAVTCQTAGVR